MARPADYEEKLALYEEKIDRDVWRWRKDNIDVDLEDMARGGDGGPVGGGATIRSKFFPGWHDKDFQNLRKALAERERAALGRVLLQEAEEEIARLLERAKMYDIDKRELRDAILRALG